MTRQSSQCCVEVEDTATVHLVNGPAHTDDRDSAAPVLPVQLVYAKGRKVKDTYVEQTYERRETRATDGIMRSRLSMARQ